MSEGKVITVPANFTPRDYQLELFQALDGVEGRPETKKKRAFLRWHRRAGKDLGCLAYMFKEAVRKPGIYYYFLPSYQQGRKIVWEGMTKDGMKFLDMLPDTKEIRKRTNNQEMLIELTNGSIFRVIGTDNIDTIVGTNPIGCIFSEYSLQDPRAWEFIRPILAENGGWAVFNGTPRGRNHMYEMDIRVEENKNWYYSTLQTLWADKKNYTGIVSPEQIAEERNTGMDEETVEQEYGVSYAAGMKGAFYSDCVEQARSEGRIGLFDHDANKWVDTFWDLGIDDSTSIWFRQLDGNRIIWIDYMEDSGKDIAYYVSKLQEKGYKYRTHYLPHDGANRSIQTQFRTDDILRFCLREAKLSDDVVIAPRLKVQDGINAVRARFSRYFFNSTNCFDAIKMIELYHRRWDPKRQVFLKDPVHDWTSHCADALRIEGIAEELTDQDDLPQFQNKIITDYDIFDD